MTTRTIFGAVIAAILFVASWSSAKDLIEPTRTLEGGEKQTGRISIFSEPPEMAVFVDGKKVGVTPLINYSLDGGTHVVSIEQDKTEVYVTADKPIRLAYFKGQFIEVPEKPATAGPPAPAVIETPKAPPPPPAARPENPPSPFYWPTNPSGRIY